MMAVGSPRTKGASGQSILGVELMVECGFHHLLFATAMICFGIKMVLRSLEFGEDSQIGRAHV